MSRTLRALLVAALVAPGTLALAAPPDRLPDRASDRAREALGLLDDCPVALPDVDGEEPPCNPFLAASQWGTSHRSSYAQASSPFPGPQPGDVVEVDHKGTVAAPIVLAFSGEYDDGGRTVWASTVGATGEIFKLDPETMTFIDKFIPQLEQPGSPPGSFSVSGAYNVLDVDDRLIVGREDSLEVYGDAVEGDRFSPIAQLATLTLPDAARCGDDDRLVGITMTYDGRIAFATELGVVGTVPREPELLTAANVRAVSLNGPGCAGGPSGTVEEVSNSIAADEQGGIYVVTSEAMYRVDDDGSSIDVAWRSVYEGAGNSGGGRLGAGSGSTPSLMGTGDDDRFVVITDGQELMHLVLMWRDEVPDGWEPIAEGRDPRIACEIPVTFGRDVDASLSEQSVLVRGHAAFVVNNEQALDPALSQLPQQAAPVAQLVSGIPGNAPTGMERFDWDPVTRSCATTWANPDVALPNGIPTMSADSGIVYGIGSRAEGWTLEGLDADTGEVVLTVATDPLPISNSFYAGTTVGPDGAIWTGTFGGVTRFLPCPDGEPCGVPATEELPVLGPLPTQPEALVRDLTGLGPDDLAPTTGEDAGRSFANRDCFWGVPDDPDLVNVAYPDTGARYWGGLVTIPPGGELVLRGEFPHARYMSFNVYDPLLRPVDGLADVLIAPDEGSTNPFVVGADRDADARSYTVRVVSGPVPEGGREPNTVHLSAQGQAAPGGIVLYRIYVPDAGLDRTGGVPLPQVTSVDATGTEVPRNDACDLPDLPVPSTVNDLVAGADGLPPILPVLPNATSPATFEKFFNLPHTQAGRLENTPLSPLRALVPADDTGGYLSNVDNAYVSATTDRGNGEVLVLTGLAPSTPSTRDGRSTMPGGDLRYFSICQNEANSTRYVGCVYDEDMLLDDEGRYTIVVSTPAARPATATQECGVSWLPWGPTQQGLVIVRHMLPADDFPHAIQRVGEPSELADVLGPYLPSGDYTSTDGFVAPGCA